MMEAAEYGRNTRVFTSSVGEKYVVSGAAVWDYPVTAVLERLCSFLPHTNLPPDQIVPYDIGDVMFDMPDILCSEDDCLQSPPTKKINCMATPTQFRDRCSGITKQMQGLSPYKDMEGISKIDWAAAPPDVPTGAKEEEGFVVNRPLALVPSGSLSDTVAIETMPEPYFKDQFLHWMNSQVIANFPEDRTILIESISQLPNKSGVVKLNSAASAAKLATLKLTYEKLNLSLRHLLSEISEPATEPTPKLLITGLKSPFFADHFLHHLQLYLSKVKLNTKIMNTPELAEEGDSVIIELGSVEEAVKVWEFSAAHPFKYSDHNVAVNMIYNAVIVCESACLTDKVAIEAMPTPYFKDQFLHWINTQIIANYPEDRTIKIESISQLPNKSGVVKLDSAASAAKLATLKLKYEDLELILRHLKEGVSPQVPSRKVSLSGVKSPFFADHFLHHLQLYLTKVDLSTKIMNTPELDKEGDSVVIELSSVADATKFIELTVAHPFSYETVQIKCNQLYDSVVEDVDLSTPFMDSNTLVEKVVPVSEQENKGLSCQVSMSGLPHPFSQVDFLSYVNTHSDDAGITDDNILGVSDLISISTRGSVSTVIIKFRSSADALAFCSYNGNFPLEYKGVKLNAKQLTTEELFDVDQFDLSLPNLFKGNNIHTSSPVSASVKADDQQDPDYVDLGDADDKEDIVYETLKGTVKTKAFLDCCRQQQTGPTFKATAVNFGRVVDLLLDLYNYKVTQAECTTKWKSLSDKFRTEKKMKGPSSEWEFRFDMARLKGEPGVFGSKKKRAQVPTPSPSKVVSTKVNKKRTPLKKKPASAAHSEDNFKFSDPATLYLISLRRDLDQNFDSNSYRHSELWQIIANKMNAAGHECNARQCEGKMQRLMDKYKLYEENRSHTGNNTAKFKFAEEMSDFMSHWVNVKPKCTISFGCVFKLNLGKKSDE